MPAAASAKPRILCVDDEPHVLEGLRDSLRRSYDVRIAESGAEALELLRRDRRGYALVISDMRMPAMNGAAFLREAQRVAPLAVRMLLTGYTDTQSAIQAVNEGQIFRFLTKPCDRDELHRACAAALWQHRLQAAERVLLEQTVHGSVNALTDVLALADPAAFGRGARLKKTIGRLARETGHDDVWEFEVAALLANIGAITLPDGTAERLYAAEPLAEHEQAMVARIPEVSARILGSIPRLDGVVAIIAGHQQRFDGDEQLPIGARLLRVVIDFHTLEAEGASEALALDAMRGRTGLYDPELVEALAKIVGTRPQGGIVEVSVEDLRIGMTLADDVRGEPGNLLLSRGHAVTPELIERLRNFRPGYVREPIRVTES